MLDDIVDVFSHLLLTGYCFGDGVGSGRVDFLSQVQQEVEVSVFQAALLDVLVLTHVFLQVLLGRLVADHCWEVAFLDDGEFVVLGGSKCDLDQEEFGLELSGIFAADDEGRVGIGGSM